MIQDLHRGPYKGIESYQTADAGLFFGREEAALAVVDRVVSSGFTLLYAPSGAGKTSLLNARIIPELEARGWSPLRVRPVVDPVQEIRSAMLEQLLPSPTLKAEVLRHAVEALPATDEDPTVAEILSRYDTLPLSDVCRRDLIIPRHDEAGRERTAFFCRVLRLSLDLEHYAESLEALRVGSVEHTTRITDSTCCRDLARYLTGAR